MRPEEMFGIWPLDLDPLSVVTFCFVSLLIGYIVYQFYLSPLATIPGPFAAKISRAWITWHSWKGNLNRVLIKLHKKHGKLVRVAPNEVYVL
jgi:hypothetical protein